MDYTKIYEEFKLKGLFSEYLPPCFVLDRRIFNRIPKENCDLIQPFSFTMSRFNETDARRIIHIPEIGAYCALNNFIKQNNIIEELMDFINQNSCSYSKVFFEDGTIIKHEQEYGQEPINNHNAKSKYIDNIVEKVIKSKGARKILKLDIANCYSSIYTHYIPAILLGDDEAEKIYKYNLNKGEYGDDEEICDNDLYKKYLKLDMIVRRQNKNQTNGLLVGPVVSRLIVEALLTRIDIELKENNILFSRYVDDYEIYLFDNDEEYIKSKFISILRKYGLSLNYEKTKVIGFPYYMVENFDRLIEQFRTDQVDEYDMIKIFNIFFELEKSGVKGAIRYLIKKIEKNTLNHNNRELFNSYIVTIMANNPRSLTKACSLLISENRTSKLDKSTIEQLKYMLDINIRKEYDLEVIWILYVLIETNNIKYEYEIIENILDSNNELAKLLLLRKELLKPEQIEKLKCDADSWILNYELFVSGYKTEDEFFKRMGVKNNIEFYNYLKKNEVHLCYPSKQQNSSIYDKLKKFTNCNSKLNT